MNKKIEFSSLLKNASSLTDIFEFYKRNFPEKKSFVLENDNFIPIESIFFWKFMEFNSPAPSSRIEAKKVEVPSLLSLSKKAPPLNPKSKLIIGKEVSCTNQNFKPFLVSISFGLNPKTSSLKKKNKQNSKNGLIYSNIPVT